VRPRPRAAVAACLFAVAAPATAGCSATLPASHVVGPSVGDITVLADSRVVPALQCAMAQYARGQERGIKFGAGQPDAIASAVKDGEPTDVAILPTGAALDRVRDELATPPARIFAPPTATTFWVAAVTDKGLRFARFLSGRQGRSLLRSPECTRRASRPTG
jgi:hypothetical protein